MNRCLIGDCRDGMAELIAAGVRVATCVTSPPYWGLRDYGVAGQLGLEPTIAEYVENMVDVFRLVRELLADDGTLWLNLGDSYSAGSDNPSPKHSADNVGMIRRAVDLRPKNLCGIPWRVAFALQADGWYLRSDIIWAKPNPMPESVTDRPTKAHEYLFLLARSERYLKHHRYLRPIMQPSDSTRKNGPSGASHCGADPMIMGLAHRARPRSIGPSDGDETPCDGGPP